MTSLDEMRRELREKYERLERSNPSPGELSAEEIEVCTDILEKLRETRQIYIVDLDYPISVTKTLFKLFDAMRRKRAEKIGIPEVQYDIEAYIFDLIRLPHSSRERLPEDVQRRIERVLKKLIGGEEEVQTFNFWDSTKVTKEEDWFVHKCPICTSSEFENLKRKKEIFLSPYFTERLSDEMLAFLMVHEAGHRECEPEGGGEFCASVKAVDMFRDRELAKRLAKEWYHRWWYETPVLEKREFMDQWKNLMEQLERR